MQYYSAKIRLAGSTMNEVQKILSAPEILVLQYIHGVDAVVNVSIHEEKRINLREEKERLKGIYDQALVKRDQSIDTIFGPLGAVPERLPEDLVERFGMVDEDDVISVAKNVTQADKRANHSQTMTQNEQDRMDHVVPADQVALEDMAG
jgi:protoporphyrinogen oxidase